MITTNCVYHWHLHVDGCPMTWSDEFKDVDFFLSGVCMVQRSAGGACRDILVTVRGGHGLHAGDAASWHVG